MSKFVEYMMRFISSYPIPVNNERFVKTVLFKCEDLINQIAFLEKEDNDMEKSHPPQRTRKIVSEKNKIAERNVLREKIRREVALCQLVYWEKFDKIQREKCEKVMNLSANGIVFTALPS